MVMAESREAHGLPPPPQLPDGDGARGGAHLASSSAGRRTPKPRLQPRGFCALLTPSELPSVSTCEGVFCDYT